MDYQVAANIIITLKDADLELRNTLIQSGELGNGYDEEMEKLHKKNAEMLDKIMDEIGYPTAEKVGIEASEAAWLIIQHAIGAPNFMKKSVTLLEQEMDDNKDTLKNLAYLKDRIAVFEGKKQLYGTQFDWDEAGKLSPNLYDEIDEVNKRRKQVGLNSLEEQILIMRNRMRNENQLPPTDFKERKQKFDEWRRAVGWIK
ncbi:TPA: DUF6624 domain-containing protein [Elizabethkingia anophelis]